jgi:hypothetical protein
VAAATLVAAAARPPPLPPEFRAQAARRGARQRKRWQRERRNVGRGRHGRRRTASDVPYPLSRDHGHAQMMVRFFALLQKYYGQPGQQMPAMNWGQFVHFMSGAAKADLKPQATTAFGWPAEWDAQLAQAKQDFPQITY